MFFLLYELVHEDGTKVMREIYENNLDGFLRRLKEDPSVEKQLKRSINPKLIAKGFTSPADHDISSLYVLLRHAGLKPKQFQAIDQIRQARNMLAHSKNITLSLDEFKRKWTEIVDLLVQLGGDKYKKEEPTQDKNVIYLVEKDLEALQTEMHIRGTIEGSGSSDHKLFRPPGTISKFSNI